jgi:hypothetical protein
LFLLQRFPKIGKKYLFGLLVQKSEGAESVTLEQYLEDYETQVVNWLSWFCLYGGKFIDTICDCGFSERFCEERRNPPSASCAPEIHCRRWYGSILMPGAHSLKVSPIL